ncbi:MAG: hypothetical protein JEZ06_16750 [Anaerolineaceae bacterium]|nr:hypothetical protein [Anaerolineaceae bacterium]
MPTLILNQEEVTRLLSIKDCIDVMQDTLSALAHGDARQPLRSAMPLPDHNVIAWMPSYLGNLQTAGVKVISVFPHNHSAGLDAHQGAVLLFEGQHGRLKGIVDATAITAIRTAAVSAAATKLLSNPDAQTLAILGAGTQASAHLEAILAVRNIRQVRIWSLPLEQAQDFAHRESLKHHIPIQVLPDAQQAVWDADIICTTTPASEPILNGEWLSPGVHINAVGSSIPKARELDSDAVVRSRLFVDRLESTISESGDYLVPLREGLITQAHIQGEIGDILIGKISGRQSPEEITLFKSLGLGIEDLAAAEYVYQKALETGMGISVDLGGQHFGS